MIFVCTFGIVTFKNLRQFFGSTSGDNGPHWNNLQVVVRTVNQVNPKSPCSMSVPKPNHNRSQSRVRLRFGRQCKRIQFRFSIKAIFALTGLAAILIGALNWLFRSHWPLLPTLALVPPIVAIFILLSLTENKIWRGILLGGLAAIFTSVVSDEYGLLSYSENWHEWPNSAIRLTNELLHFWIFFRIAGFSLVGGCIDAIRLRSVSLGVYSLFATFIYYFGLILVFIWIVCSHYWK